MRLRFVGYSLGYSIHCMVDQMTNDQILEMALITGDATGAILPSEAFTMHFARLIAAAQREIDAQICECLNKNIGDSLLYEAADAIRKGGKS